MSLSMAILLTLLGLAAVGQAPASPERSLRPLPAPDLTLMEVAVQEQLGAAREAVARTEEELTDRPSLRADAWGRLGQLYLLYLLPEAAGDAFANASQLAPEDFRWHYFLGYVHRQAGRLGAAAAQLERAVEIDPDSVPALLHMGRLELERNRLDEADARFRRVLALAPGSAAAAHGLGEIAQLRGDHEEAVRWLESALAAQPSATAIHYQLALSHRALRNLDAARAHLERKGEQRVVFPDPLVDRLDDLATGAGIHLARGHQAKVEGRYGLAAEAFRQAMEADPDNLLAAEELASVLALDGNVGAALETYRIMLEKDPDRAISYYNVGRLLVDQGRVGAAIPYFRRAVELAPDFGNAHFNLALALEETGALAEAEDHLGQAVTLDPLDHQARLRYAQVMARRDRVEEAVEALAPALAAGALGGEIGPEVWAFQAGLLGRLGRFGEAATTFQLVIDAAPDNQDAHFGRAIALMLAGDDAAARRSLEQSLVTLPGSAALTHALARLLAASSDPAVRDGERALALAQQVLQAQPSLDHAETVAMAYAELGLFAEAGAFQESIVERARAEGRSEHLPRLEARLERYRRSQPVRSPWRDLQR